jgi:hypothetical protein
MAEKSFALDILELIQAEQAFYDAAELRNASTEIRGLLDFESLAAEIRNHHPRVESTIDDFILS